MLHGGASTYIKVKPPIQPPWEVTNSIHMERITSEKTFLLICEVALLSLLQKLAGPVLPPGAREEAHARSCLST